MQRGVQNVSRDKAVRTYREIPAASSRGVSLIEVYTEFGWSRDKLREKRSARGGRMLEMRKGKMKSRRLQRSNEEDKKSNKSVGEEQNSSTRQC